MGLSPVQVKRIVLMENKKFYGVYCWKVRLWKRILRERNAQSILNQWCFSRWDQNE